MTARPPLALVVALSFTGALFLLRMNWGQRERLGSGGVQDFTALYVGAALVGTPGLYNPQANLALQDRLVGTHRESVLYTRPPFWAALLRPLTWLSYTSALLLWKAIMAAALVAFVWLQPFIDRRWAALAIFWSVPIGDVFFNGQDSPLLLAWSALSLRLHRQGRPFWAGLALTLAAAKFHFLILLPVVLVVQRQLRYLAGLAAGGGVLAVISFVVQGWRWPVEYAAVLGMPIITEIRRIMPTLFGLAAEYRWPPALTALCVLAVVGSVTSICRRGSFESGVAACLFGAVLISPHAYAHDLTVTLPALLLWTTQAPLRPIAIGLLTPAPFLVVREYPFLWTVPVVFLSAILLVWKALRARPSHTVVAA
jgi:hypothetical protein